VSDIRLNIIPEAEQDLREIWHYTMEKWGEPQAERYLHELLESCRHLAELRKIPYDPITQPLEVA